MSLSAWLADVTAPFPEATAARLRTEFTAHHADALEALLAAGHPDPRAEALRTLGYASGVRRALETQYYTAAELGWLQEDRALRRRLVGRPRLWSGALNVVALLLVPVALWLVPSVNTVFVWSAALAFWGLVLIMLGAQVWVRRARSATSAAVLERVAFALHYLLIMLSVLLMRQGFNIAWEVLETATMMATQLAVWWWRRPSAALVLARKAWRNAV